MPVVSYVYVVTAACECDDETGSCYGRTVEAVYQEKQPADQHAARIYGGGRVSRHQVRHALPDHLTRRGNR